MANVSMSGDGNHDQRPMDVENYMTHLEDTDPTGLDISMQPMLQLRWNESVTSRISLTYTNE